LLFLSAAVLAVGKCSRVVGVSITWERFPTARTAADRNSKTTPRLKC